MHTKVVVNLQWHCHFVVCSCFFWALFSVLPAVQYGIECTCRKTGRAEFSYKLLSRDGILIDVPLHKALEHPDELAKYLESRLEAAVPGGLNAYRS